MTYFFCKHGILLSAMFGLTKNSPDTICGAILDIGSARVDMQIVIADPLETGPIVVWSHTERVLASEATGFDVLAKKIITASTNAFLALGSQGIQTLRTYDPHAKITVCNVLIGAPWAHTVTQKVSYHKEEPFEVTSTLLEEILQKAEAEIVAHEEQKEFLTSLDLTLLHKKTNGCQLNGYSVKNPIGKKVLELDIQHTVGVVHGVIDEGVRTSHETIIQGAELQSNTKIATLKDASKIFNEKGTPYALVLLSGEATEVGFIDGQSLTSSTFDEWGHNTVIRHIMDTAKRPYVDVLSMLTQPVSMLKSQLEDISEGLYEEVCTLVKDHILRSFGRLQIADHNLSTLYFDADPALCPFFETIFDTLSANSTVSFANIHSIASALTHTDDSGSATDNVLARVFHITQIKK